MAALPQPDPAPAANSDEADLRIAGEVRRRLRDYEPLRATRARVDVAVHGGRVALSGRTRTEALRLIAAYLASFVPGVVAIENRIVSDDQVVRAVAEALAADPITAPHVLRVASRYGAVTLSGEVPGTDIEQHAMEIAAGVPIVVAVRSDIAIVRPPGAEPGADGAMRQRVQAP